MPLNLLAQALLVVALTALQYILSPKPKTPKLEPADKIDVPGSIVGKEIPVIFGTVIIRDPNVPWFGDIKTKAIKKKGGKK